MSGAPNACVRDQSTKYVHTFGAKVRHDLTRAVRPSKKPIRSRPLPAWLRIAGRLGGG